MKVLFVYGGNNSISPFIEDQYKALQDIGVNISLFPIVGKGVLGYSKNIFLLNRYIKSHDFDLIHAHYGLSGLVSSFQSLVPTVTTYHGTDINSKMILIFSKLSINNTVHSIFVSENLKKLSNVSSGYSVIPCGVDLDIFCNNDDHSLKLNKSNIKILFSSSFDRKVKNYPLARESIKRAESKMSKKIELIELKNYSRKDVSKLLNNVDVALLTSNTEGSPQFIKEAMACNCPAVATNVGDINWLFGNEQGYYLSDHNPDDISDNIIRAINFSRDFNRTNGRKRLIYLGLDSKNIAKKIKNVYENILKNK